MLKKKKTLDDCLSLSLSLSPSNLNYCRRTPPSVSHYSRRRSRPSHNTSPDTNPIDLSSSVQFPAWEVCPRIKQPRVTVQRETRDMRRKCRIWWPKKLTSPSSATCPHDLFLFGWFSFNSSSSVDVIVAFACDQPQFSRSRPRLPEILHDTNGAMPTVLQDKMRFSLIGYCSCYSTGNDRQLKVERTEASRRTSSNCGSLTPSNRKEFVRGNYDAMVCGCHQLDGLDESCTQNSIGSSDWIQIVCDSVEKFGRDFNQVPKLHHIHWDGQIVSCCDVHVIVYETPMYGAHHFSLDSRNFNDQVNAPLKKPNWVEGLQRNQPLLDLNRVILAINTAAAANKNFMRCEGSRRSKNAILYIIDMCFDFMWKVSAITLASISTVVYVIVQLFHMLSCFGSKSWIYVTMLKLFSTTGTTIQIRCQQLLYWPIFLQDNGLRSQSCVEYAEKAALQRHSVWSSLAIDLLLGNLTGLALLVHAESACLWLSDFAYDFTNEVLRSGCVWLMGVPAGFKLNVELAGILGMISLHAIQIWSALWIFIGFFSVNFIKALALAGVIFGETVLASFILDLLFLASFHVSILHWAVSLLYSGQIQSLAALWRLFRGRKWNPLRQRLDSYEYTVKQHIVGSLLFTPLLLLLPSTSVFYIFFTILSTTVTLIAVLIEVTISLIHSTPWTKIYLSLVGRRRLPSGIWFEILSSRRDGLDVLHLNGVNSSSAHPMENEACKGGCSILVSVLHSNFLSVGQVISPNWKKAFSGISGFIKTLAYGALTGKRTPTTLGTNLPSTLPWIVVSSKEYWFLCYKAIMSCMPEHD